MTPAPPAGPVSAGQQPRAAAGSQPCPLGCGRGFHLLPRRRALRGARPPGGITVRHASGHRRGIAVTAPGHQGQRVPSGRSVQPTASGPQAKIRSLMTFAGVTVTRDTFPGLVSRTHVPDCRTHEPPEMPPHVRDVTSPVADDLHVRRLIQVTSPGVTAGAQEAGTIGAALPASVSLVPGHRRGPSTSRIDVISLF